MQEALQLCRACVKLRRRMEPQLWNVEHREIQPWSQQRMQLTEGSVALPCQEGCAIDVRSDLILDVRTSVGMTRDGYAHRRVDASQTRPRELVAIVPRSDVLGSTSRVLQYVPW